MEEQFNFDVSMDNLRQNLINYYNLVQDKLPDMVDNVKDEVDYNMFIDCKDLKQTIDKLSGAISTSLIDELRKRLINVYHEIFDIVKNIRNLHECEIHPNLEIFNELQEKVNDLRLAIMPLFMGGLREGLINAYNEIFNVVQNIRNLHECEIHPNLEIFNELQEKVNDLRSAIASLLFIYSEDPNDRFSDMSDIVLKSFEEQENKIE